MKIKNKVLNIDRLHIAVEENDILQFECRLLFWGNWQPTMRWELQGRILDTQDSTLMKVNNSVTSTLELVINSTIFPHPFIRLECTTYFAMEHKPSPMYGTKTSANCPGYNFTWHAPDLVINSGRNYMTGNYREQFEYVHLLNIWLRYLCIYRKHIALDCIIRTKKTFLDPFVILRGVFVEPMSSLD